MQPQIKINGVYLTLPDAVKLFGQINLRYVSANNSIQVRDESGKFLGNVKYEYDYAAKTVSE